MGHTSSVRACERFACPTKAVAGMAVLAAVGSGGCSLGFDAFDPLGSADGGATDSSAPAEGGSDSATTQDVSIADDAGVDALSEMDTGSELDSASPVEAGCSAMQSCLTTASSCGMTCNQAYSQCAGMCMGGNAQQCRSACKSTQQKCRATCAQTCASCTAQAGCPDNAGCTTAAQM